MNEPVQGYIPFRIRLLIAYRRFFVATVRPFIPFVISYDQGWLDGWNSCRLSNPSDREFMTREKMEKRYNTVPSSTVPSAESLFNRDNVQ